MKVESTDLLNMIGDTTKEIVENNPEWSEEALMVMKELIDKLFKKLFEKEMEDVGIKPEDFDKFN